MVRVAVPVVVFLLLCGAVFFVPPARASRPAASEPQWASPAEMERLLEQEYLDRHLPGLAVTILLHGDVYLEANYGEAAPGGPPVSQETPFVLGSTSKQFTGLVVQQLIADGRLALDAPVRSILPELGTAGDRWSRVTIAHLLAHRSGLTRDNGMERWGWGADPVSIGADVRRLAGIQLAAEPGERYEYSNANYDLLGAVVQRITGERFEDALHQFVVEPLGLTSTTSNLDVAQTDGLATGNFTWLRRWNSAVPGSRPPSAAPSAFISSSAHDLTRLLQAHLGESTGMGDSVLMAAREPVDAVTDEVDYASGWFVRPLWEVADGNARWREMDPPVIWEHKGDTSRSQSIVAMVPQYGLGVVILSNTGLGTDTGSQRWMLDAVLHGLLGTTPEEPATDSLVAAAPVLMVAVPLLQLVSVVSLARARPSGPSRARSRAAVVVAVVLTVVGLILALWVVPDQVGTGLLSSWWWVAAPDLAIAVGLILALALIALILLGRAAALGLRRRSPAHS